MDVKRAGVQYTVYTLVGACYRNTATNDIKKPCQKYTGYDVVEPPTVPAGSARMLRIIVVVTWAPIGDECQGTCSYDVATLVDPSEDLAWNRVIKPVAVDDEYKFGSTDTIGYPSRHGQRRLGIRAQLASSVGCLRPTESGCRNGDRELGRQHYLRAAARVAARVGVGHLHFQVPGVGPDWRVIYRHGVDHVEAGSRAGQSAPRDPWRSSPSPQRDGQRPGVAGCSSSWATNQSTAPIQSRAQR